VIYDIVIAGGGPSGLSAALALGRARKRVLLCDAGPRRNAAATHIHNFVTRDGTPPDEFRAVARAQLAAYPNVEIADENVASIEGSRGAFRIGVGARTVEARRVLLATGMIDETVAIASSTEVDGFAERWGHSIVQCPYCHGWEARDRAWGFLVLPQSAPHFLVFALQLRGWSRDVTVFTDGAELADADREQLRAAGIRLETTAIARLDGADGALESVVLANGERVACDLLFAHPKQRHVPLVQALGIALDDDGYAKVDPMKRETSIPGIYASGDLSTRMQGAILAAASGTQAAAVLNAELTAELALAGAL
jgi:thioredoxin reductase